MRINAIEILGRKSGSFEWRNIQLELYFHLIKNSHKIINSCTRIFDISNILKHQFFSFRKNSFRILYRGFLGNLGILGM